MIFQADAALIPFADRTFHCVVTSPPYWGLRKYAGEQGRGMFPNLGLEPSPQEHIERMVTIFSEVKRVLRDDGVVWLNYGDCYASSWASGRRNLIGNPSRTNRVNRMGEGLKEGDLCLMPHRVAIALQDDGWIVRNDLIWFKKNPMPESCAGWRFERSRKEKSRHKDFMKNKRGDGYFNEQSGSPDLIEYEYGEDYELRKGSWRHTRAHEYIFMLTKKMQYWCNQEAVRVKHDDPSRGKGEHESKTPHMDEEGKRWVVAKRKYNPSGRNPRTVLDVPTSPYKGAHYATFPPNLIAPLIRASCPRRACPECGQGWSPVVEPSERYAKLLGGSIHDHSRDKTRGQQHDKEQMAAIDAVRSSGLRHAEYLIKDYRPTCECGHDEYVPGITLDPFIGSGTTGAVARELQRRWVGLDISMEYLDEQAKVRALKLTPSKALEGLPLFEEINSDLE